MRFAEKLAKQRKEHNLSQEQLAERMSVSRQAVSKWESSASYPDMDKIIQLCSILDCKLEDLLDDGVIKENTESSKVNINKYLQDFLKFITKTSNMFYSMKWRERLKCIFEILFVGIIVSIIGYILCNILSSVIDSIINILPFNAYYISEIIRGLLQITFISLILIVILQVFKVRYLDYFATIEDESVSGKTLEKDIEKTNNSKAINTSRDKIIIRDLKHSSLSFFDFLFKIIVFLVKGFLTLCAIPIMLFFIFLVFCMIVSMYYIMCNTIFIWITLVILGSILLIYVGIKFIYNFIFNCKHNYRKGFLLIIIGLFILGSGIGLTFVRFLSFDIVKNNDDLVKLSETKNIQVNESTRLFFHNSVIDYVIDNKAEDVKIEITYLKDLGYSFNHYNNDEIEYYVFDSNYNFSSFYDLFIEDIKNNKIHIKDDSIRMDIKVSLSQKDYDILYKN